MDLFQKHTQSMQPMQRLMMLPKMQQALHILQMPKQELEQYIEDFLSDNPLAVEEELDSQENEETETKSELEELTFNEKDLSILQNLDEEVWDGIEEAAPFSKKEQEKQTFIEATLTNKPSLYEHLMQQAREQFAMKEDLEIAEIIIGNLDDHGFFAPNWSEWEFLYHYSEHQLRKILKVIQSFDPSGIAATSLQESFLIQLENKKLENSLAYKVIENYFDDLLHNRILNIQRKLQCKSLNLKQIQGLDRNPAASFNSHVAQTIVPDLEFLESDGQLQVIIANQSLPEIHINKRYLRMMEDPKISLETKTFLSEYLNSLKWLMKNLSHRTSLLERAAHIIAKKQRQFLTEPHGKLIPLTMKELSKELKVNESTITRTMSNKYFSSIQGVLPLSMLFSHGKSGADMPSDLSANSIQKEIFEIIENEDKRHPLSDAKIALKLESKGISCARRTIAKYREILKIGNAQQRKRFN